MKLSFPIFKSLIALSIGTLGLCMSEFSMMGVLPEIAGSLNITIPEAGHFISAYALGVCVGAPVLAIFCRDAPLRTLTLFLMAFFICGNFLTACAFNESFMLAARFIAGLPHGGYFGVASIMAARLAGPAYSVLAVAIVVFGATVANLLGVPFSTFAAWLASWRLAYGLVAVIGIIAIVCIWKIVPDMGGMKDEGLAKEFGFLRSGAPWLIFAAVMMGNGGMFCWYSYVTPYMRNVAHIPEAWTTGVMVLAGMGMVCGNLLSGRLSRFFKDYKLAAGFQIIMALTLLLIYFIGADKFAALSLMFIAAACLFGLSAPQQMLLLETSPGGQMLGAALAQVGFNLGNAIGAYAGGLTVAQGFGYRETALTGAIIAFIGFLLLLVFWRKYSSKIKPV